MRSQLEQVKQKRELLKLLEGKLAAWEEQANFSGIPAGKRRALMGLALESKATIEAMMGKVSNDIRNCLEGMKHNNG